MTYKTFSEHKIIRWNGELKKTNDFLVEEVPIAIEYNGISHAVMLATPSDLEDFALGFSITEEIIQSPDELYDCEIIEEKEGLLLALKISSERLFSLKDRKRSLAGKTGCGLCGLENIKHASRPPEPIRQNIKIEPEIIHNGFHAMEDMQKLKQKTGASHAVAWMNTKGEIILIREDVGRHNALDKIIGALYRTKTDLSDGMILTTSRASYEMIEKTAIAKISAFAARSAPTALAVHMAKKIGIKLIGFVKEKSHVIYT